MRSSALWIWKTKYYAIRLKTIPELLWSSTITVGFQASARFEMFYYKMIELCLGVLIFCNKGGGRSHKTA